MKLSEAIRLGASAIPWSYGYDGCAIGAAVYAIGRHRLWRQSEDPVYEEAEREWPFLRRDYAHPLSGEISPLLTIIGHLNGFSIPGPWTRPQIAAWVATIEPAEEAVVEVQHEQEVPHVQVERQS